MKYINYLLFKESVLNNEATDFHGTSGSGCVPYCPATDRYMLGWRSDLVDQPGTLAGFGGAMEPGLSPETNALKELEEEIGLPDARIVMIEGPLFEQAGFTFHNFLAVVEEEWPPKPNWEVSEAAWMSAEEALQRLADWHFGLKHFWRNSHTLFGPA